MVADAGSLRAVTCFPHWRQRWLDRRRKAVEKERKMIVTENTGERAARERAYALADTGRYDSVHAVENALIAEGWPNAGEVLAGEYVRKTIAERCQAAAKAH
jgi:hypothetical protein